MSRLDARHLKPARLVPPPSKSDAQRALVLAHALGDSTLVRLGDVELPRDVLRLRAGLELLAKDGAEIDCGDGGAPFRFLLAQAAISPGTRTFVGTARLAERPHEPLNRSLMAALADAGLRIDGRPWPLIVHAASKQAAVPRFEIDASQSSQFASSLLLAAASLSIREKRPWTVALLRTPASEGYLSMSVDWLRRAGFEVVQDGPKLSVSAGSKPLALAVPGDWSSLGYLLLCGWASGSVVCDVELEADHPDKAIVRTLETTGLTVAVRSSGELLVTGDATRSFSASGEECVDLLPTLAALACILPQGEHATLTHVRILQEKESDRLEGIRALVDAAGGTTRFEGPDTLVIAPPAQRPSRLRIAVRGDHRMAMSAATLAVLCRAELELDEPECVAKSFPGFWAELAKLGATLR